MTEIREVKAMDIHRLIEENNRKRKAIGIDSSFGLLYLLKSLFDWSNPSNPLYILLMLAGIVAAITIIVFGVRMDLRYRSLRNEAMEAIIELNERGR